MERNLRRLESLKVRFNEWQRLSKCRVHKLLLKEHGVLRHDVPEVEQDRLQRVCKRLDRENRLGRSAIAKPCRCFEEVTGDLVADYLRKRKTARTLDLIYRKKRRRIDLSASITAKGRSVPVPVPTVHSKAPVTPRLPKPAPTAVLGAASVRTILVLAANPKDSERRRFDEEVKKIEHAWERSKLRDQFKLVVKWAVTDDDLRRALLDCDPEVVHFAGHGLGSGQGGSGRDFITDGEDETGGLAFEDDSGRVQLISGDTLAKLFELCADSVKCVVLNACYSEVQADAITRHIDYVVGMKNAIGDQAAIKFAVGFYDALWAGRNYEVAFKIGRIAMKGTSEHLTPVLKTRQKSG